MRARMHTHTKTNNTQHVHAHTHTQSHKPGSIPESMYVLGNTPEMYVLGYTHTHARTHTKTNNTRHARTHTYSHTSQGQYLSLCMCWVTHLRCMCWVTHTHTYNHTSQGSISATDYPLKGWAIPPQ